MRLDVGLRLRLLELLQGYQGGVVDLKVVRDLTDKVGLSEEDFKKFGVKVADNRIVWDSTVEAENIEVGDKGREIVCGLLKKRDEEKTLSVAELPLWEMFMEEGADVS